MAKRKRQFFYGDCRDVMAGAEIPPESVDLIYLDPPFNSNACYGMLFGSGRGRKPEQAFSDLWCWGPEDRRALERIRDGAAAGDDRSQCLATALEALESLLGACGSLSYLIYMGERLVPMRALLKRTGSIYLHCDPTMSHYLKILMDAVFGPENFRNQIVWAYSGGGVPRKDFPRKHDIILRYTKSGSKERVFNVERKPYKQNTRQVGKHSTYSGGNAIDLERGTPVTDCWTDIKTVTGWNPERLGYPTQKPLALLERIVQVSTHPGDLVLDPFAGCGTALEAAERNGRSWIGIDIAWMALDMLIERLRRRPETSTAVDELDLRTPATLEEAEAFHDEALARWGWRGATPTTLQEAENLARREGGRDEKHGRNAGRFDFQRFACSLVQARPSAREIGDGGVDGVIRFPGALDSRSGEATVLEYLVEVKSGRIGEPDLRRLLGSVADRGAAGGLMLTLRRSETRGLNRFCERQGQWRSSFDGQSYPKLQISSVEELLESKKAGDHPTFHGLPKPYRPYSPDRRVGKDPMQKELAEWY